MSNISVKGIIQITGSNDVGKTTLGLECGADPKRILFVDDDLKGRPTVEQISKEYGFGRYVDFVEEAKGRSLLEIHKAGMVIIDSIESNQYDAIIWDTWSRFASTFKAYVTANPNEFRAPKEWPGLAQMKGATQWKESQIYEAKVIHRLEQLAGCVILITHLKDHYAEGGTRTGKRIPDSSRTLNRVPRLRLFLIHSVNGSPVPSALVLKRLDKKRFVKGVGIRTTQVLPRKMIPKTDHESLWDTVAWYQANPIGKRKPTADETPNAQELSILDGTLTKEQQTTLKLSLRIKAQELEDEQLVAQATERQGLVAEVKGLTASGLSKAKVAKRLQITVKKVREILKETK